MKKYAAVPLICKVKRFARNVFNAGIKVKNSTEVRFCKRKDVDSDKSYTIGNEYFISFKTILAAALVLCGLMLSAILALKISIAIAAGRKARRR